MSDTGNMLYEFIQELLPKIGTSIGKVKNVKMIHQNYALIGVKKFSYLYSGGLKKKNIKSYYYDFVINTKSNTLSVSSKNSSNKYEIGDPDSFNIDKIISDMMIS